jgi:hypothetical protein
MLSSKKLTQIEYFLTPVTKCELEVRNFQDGQSDLPSEISVGQNQPHLRTNFLRYKKYFLPLHNFNS